LGVRPTIFLVEQNMNQRRPGPAILKRLLCNWPTALMGSMALAGTAAAAQDASPVAAAAATNAAPTLYRVTNLGPGEGGVFINAKGQVTFTHFPPWWSDEPPHAWFYDGAHLHEIGTLGGSVVRTNGLNDHGTVTGISSTAAGLIHSFAWNRHRGMTDIGTLPGMNGAWDPVINNRGEVAGYSTVEPSPPYPRAFRWSARSGMEDLGLLLPGAESSAYARAINDDGMIAGDAWAGGSTYHAFAWTRATGMVDIDTIGARASTPVAVAANGLVAGNLMNSPSPENFSTVFWWTRSTGMHDLGPANGLGTWMFGMSSGGRIAGVIIYAGYLQHAMTWTQAHGMHDLGTLGGHSSAAVAANNRGQVVGGSVTPDDVYHAFIWSRSDGLVDLNRRLYHAPAGLVLESALGISDNGAIIASSNAGLVLLRPVRACGCAHAAGPIAAPDMVPLGAPVDASIGFTTENDTARYSVAWSWGDGTADRVRDASVARGSGSATARHIYSAPGIYTVTANVTDGAGNNARVAHRVVVYEPSGGVIAGTGTVLLPTTVTPRAAVPGGKATFSFVMPPAARTNAAGAQGRFLFSLPGFAFASNDLRVSTPRDGQARLTGTGKLNGAPGYRFTATTAAGATAFGRFGVRIWHTDPKTSADVVDYDSLAAKGGNAGRALADGKIIVNDGRALY
jgi:probable HAF family extracellular repeat protein